MAEEYANGEQSNTDGRTGIHYSKQAFAVLMTVMLRHSFVDYGTVNVNETGNQVQSVIRRLSYLFCEKYSWMEKDEVLVPGFKAERS